MLAESYEIIVIDQGPDEMPASGDGCCVGQGMPFRQGILALGNFLIAGVESQQNSKRLPDKDFIVQSFSGR